jgi:hypothetical protein
MRAVVDVGVAVHTEQPADQPGAVIVVDHGAGLLAATLAGC